MLEPEKNMPKVKSCSICGLRYTPIAGHFCPAASIGNVAPEHAVTWASPTSEGRKDDSGKPRLELIPPELVAAVGAILTFGAKKYDDRNWEKGMSWGRVFGALMRHLWAWWSRGGADPETGQSHLWHAACCISFLIAYEARATGTDDRPTSNPPPPQS